MNPKKTLGTGRRSFLKMPLAAGAMAAMGRLGAAPRKLDEYDPANPKIATAINPRATDEQLLFLQQLGLKWVHMSFPPETDFAMMTATQERLAKFGLRIHCAYKESAYRSLTIQLGRPGRDQEIEKYLGFLTDLGRLGIYCSKIDFHPGNTYTTKQIETPRGYRARQFSLEEFRKTEKQMHDRVYTADDIWSYYTYFIKAVMPTAVKANVRLALHPDDPPVDMMNGVAKIFTHYDGIKRADEIVGGSPFWGLTLCVGTWSEGGQNMGKDTYEMIKEFGPRGKISAVHFRNVSSPMPVFHETFLDDGYMDMYEVMKALRQAGVTGSLIPDHYPGIVNDPGHRLGDTYALVYMRSLLRRVNEEIG